MLPNSPTNQQSTTFEHAAWDQFNKTGYLDKISYNPQSYQSIDESENEQEIKRRDFIEHIICSKCESVWGDRHKCESQRRNQQRQEIRKINEKRRIIEERKKNMKSLTPFIIICVILALFDFLAAFSPNVCVHIPIDLKIMVLSLKQWFLIDSAICFLGVIMFGMGVLIPKDSKCFIVIMCYGVLVFGLKIFWLIIQTMIFVEGVSNQQMECA